MCHLATDLPWMAPDLFWTSVLWVVSSDASILGRAAYLQSPSALRFTDVAQQHSTLLLEWVVFPFDVLGTGMWVFGLNLMNMSRCSSESIGPMYVEVSGQSARNVPGGRDSL